ncbi:hypothetical protein T07_12297 [Trichinella nelsoni]|uniref:Uncharacterized protein n=1 Tax=Trichinella nelsoni TaxID=6336 RepID=A0A0V0SHX0_9BILA|nr:hypothetical protein T07_12297 [Trichinella nelsoni]
MHKQASKQAIICVYYILILKQVPTKIFVLVLQSRIAPIRLISSSLRACLKLQLKRNFVSNISKLFSAEV